MWTLSLDLTPAAGFQSSAEPDYPAAHSMDTIWYAVDEAGHLAAFITGENGSVPTGTESWRLLHDLYERTFGADPNDRPDSDEAGRRLGIYQYWYNDHMPLENIEVRYHRDRDGDPLLHIDQLPPDLRARWKRFRFPGVRFSEAEFLQPYEFFQCESYDVDAIGYLAADGKTIRPIPGKEEVYREVVAAWREDPPEGLNGYRFEEADDGR
jgi:hypothetical protein